MSSKNAAGSRGYRPLRSLLILFVITIGLGAWALWPGQVHTPKLGLDLQGGTQVILKPRLAEGSGTVTEESLNQTADVIRQRVNGFGVTEADVAIQGSGDNAAIVVSVPGLNQQRIADQLKQTALLDFRPVDQVEAGAPTAPAGKGKAAASSPKPPVQSTSNDAKLQQAFADLDCSKKENTQGGVPDDPTKWLVTCSEDGSAKYLLEPAFIKGTNVTNAQAGLPTQGAGGWQVDLTFDTEGAKKLADTSSKLVNLPSPKNQFAIVLDGLVQSSPYFQQAILGGQAQISGNFTAQEAQDLANILKYGALPLTLDLAEVTTVSPTLGADQLKAGLLAGLLGLALVGLYLLLYYRVLGIVAVLSLIYAAVVTYLIFVLLGRSLGLALTLAGVAGAIVAVGITADSFVVYFERIRDEIRDGRSMRAAVDAGWSRARNTLLAADFVSILAAVILYFLSVGNVRGFAFVLGLTTLIDVAIAFWFTRPLVTLIGRTKWFQKGSSMTGLSAQRLGLEELPSGARPKASRKSRAASQQASTASPEAAEQLQNSEV